MIKDYTLPSSWDVVWSRPYSNYEKHHQVFWKLIRDNTSGTICDLGVGSGSCWNDVDYRITGVDFSYEACRQAKKNLPNSSFICCDVTDTPLSSYFFDTVVLSGVVNYYEDLTEIKREANRLVKDGGKILITINVIKDFPKRTWTHELIQEQFSDLGKVSSTFYEKIGFFIAIDVP